MTSVLTLETQRKKGMCTQEQWQTMPQATGSIKSPGPVTLIEDSCVCAAMRVQLRNDS